MYYVSGGGSEYDGGEWEIKKTTKQITFICTKKPFFALCCPEVMKIRFQKERSHCLRDWEDGTYTIYPFQSGTPHVFEPLK
jgi:hypothetical protein